MKHSSTATAIHSWVQHGRLCCSISSILYAEVTQSDGLAEEDHYLAAALLSRDTCFPLVAGL